MTLEGRGEVRPWHQDPSAGVGASGWDPLPQGGSLSTALWHWVPEQCPETRVRVPWWACRGQSEPRTGQGAPGRAERWGAGGAGPWLCSGQGSRRGRAVQDEGDSRAPARGPCSPLALSALSRQMARLRLAPTSSTRGAVPSCTREGKRRSTGRGTASGSVWKKSSASSRAPCGRQTQVRELSPQPHTRSPLLQVPPHLSWSWGPCAQVSGVLVPCGR